MEITVVFLKQNKGETPFQAEIRALAHIVSAIAKPDSELRSLLTFWGGDKTVAKLFLSIYNNEAKQQILALPFVLKSYNIDSEFRDSEKLDWEDEVQSRYIVGLYSRTAESHEECRQAFLHDLRQRIPNSEAFVFEGSPDSQRVELFASDEALEDIKTIDRFLTYSPDLPFSTWPE